MTFGETQDKIKYGLNNCPFCGSVVIKMERMLYDAELCEAHKDIYDKVKKHHEKHGKPHRVHCENCGADGPPCLGPEGAATAWNKSTPKPDPLEEAIRKGKENK